MGYFLGLLILICGIMVYFRQLSEQQLKLALNRYLGWNETGIPVALVIHVLFSGIWRLE